MFTWLKSVFGSQPEEIDPIWRVMADMDDWLTHERFQSLDLSAEQRPLVKGLIDGTIKPADLPEVQRWKDECIASDDGVDALVVAMQHALGGDQVTYLFPTGEVAPAARFPNLTDEQTRTVFFDDREGHMRIASLAEFVEASGIGAYSLEKLSVIQLQSRMTGRTEKEVLDLRRKESRIPKARLSFERKADEAGVLEEPVTVEEIAAALNDEGYHVSADDIVLDQPIMHLGLYNPQVRLKLDAELRVYLWVVPVVDGS